MNGPLALHTAARRYCLDRHGYWCERYAEIVRNGGRRLADSYNYSAQALATFPRYNVLNAIRVELERIDPAKLGDLEATRSCLILIGETAEDELTARPIGEIDRRAMAEEREAFRRYISGLALAVLNAVEPLPYRRVLSVDESQSIWSGLRDRWQIPKGYWHPLVECTLSDVVAFQARAFEEAVAIESLQGMLAARGIERVWELREFGPEYEEDVSMVEPYYNGAEGYWSSGDMSWVIYAYPFTVGVNHSPGAQYHPVPVHALERT